MNGLNRWVRILNVRPGEERVSALLTGLLLLIAAGSALGGNATEALFFARFGVSLLPTMYILLGLFTFATSLLVTALLGRVARKRLYTALPLWLGGVLVVEWLVIVLARANWFYALMWLVMNLIFSLQGLLAWGLAGAVCDTRQSKRLFPLFGAGGILGTVLGGLLTPPLAAWLHTENLLLLWAAAQFACFFLCRALLRRPSVLPLGPQEPRTRVVEEMQRGFRFVRQSPILRWISISAILFSVCYFSLALPFSRGAAAQYPDADQLAGFLGLFQSLNTFVALVVSLVLANRLFARFGILPMLVIFPVIYLAGFLVLAIYAPFGILVAVRFTQLAYMNGIANTSWQAIFNVVPPEQRDQVRTFVSGVPEQTGTLLAGLILLVGERALEPQQLYLIGLFAAAWLVYILWRASQSYRQALVEALRTGQPQVFFSEERPFGGHRMDAAAVAVAVRGLSADDVSVRRVSAEIVGHFQTPEAAHALTAALTDPDAPVRAAALKGLSHAPVEPALLPISAALADPEPEVRIQAVTALSQLSSPEYGVMARLEPLLADADPLVRTRAAAALWKVAELREAKALLHQMALDDDPRVRASALRELADCLDDSAFELAASALGDPQPLVRRAAAALLAELNPPAAAPLLVSRLDDEDGSVRQALAEALGRCGEPALEPLLAALADPARADGALLALEKLPLRAAAGPIRQQAQRDAQAALQYQRLALGASQAGAADERIRLLEESLRAQALTHGLNALRALGLVTARETIGVALQNLRSPHPAQRANALETLEAVGEREIIRPLLALWETGAAGPAALPETWLADLLDDPHAWLRACAVLAAGESPAPNLNEKMVQLSCCDPDELVRSAAAHALSGDSTMETLATLSQMERILFLRRVPLFAGLPPGDLKQVAAIASEVYLSDGQTLVQQGETGSEMYILVSGEVRVWVTAGSQKEGREVARRQAGDYVGEMAVISQEPRMATLIAQGPVRALCLKQKHFESILRERPEISLAMLRILSQRLKEASSQAAGSAT